MARVHIALGQRSYDVDIIAGAFDHLGEHLSKFAHNGRLLWVTDDNLAAVYRARIQSAFANSDIDLDFFVIPAGESSKCWAQLEALTDWMLAKGIERKDNIVAFGGGVVGDLTGFAASIVKRGCNFVQIPTSLLAQVDSSVGGKTAINSTAGKNLIGAFHQPVHVLIDPLVLNSLSDREMRAGYAEVVKYGLIDDAQFFDFCEANAAKILARDPQPLQYAIAKSIESKARIVGADERETKDMRALLNLGHTFGHALEAETGYSGALIHGEAVAAGMAIAFRYSATLGLCADDVSARVSRHLQGAGLPVSIDECGISASGKRLVDHMLHDKKMDSGTLPFLLARDIGQTFVSRDVDLDHLTRFLDLEAGR